MEKFSFTPDEVIKEKAPNVIDVKKPEVLNSGFSFTPDENQEEFNPKAYDGSYFMAEKGMNNESLEKLDKFLTMFSWYMKGHKVAKTVDDGLMQASEFVINAPNKLLHFGADVGTKLREKHKNDSIGEIVDSYKEDFINSPSQVLKSFGRGTLETTKGMGTLLQILGDNFAVSPESELRGADRALANSFSKSTIYVGEIIKKASNYGLDSDLLRLDEEVFAGSFVENPSVTRTLSIVGGALPSLLSGGAIFKVTKSSILTYGLLAGAESGELYEEAKELGLGVPQATKLWGVSALGTGAVDLAFKPIEKILGSKIKATSGRVRKALVDGTREGTTESFQQIWQNMVRKYGIDDSQELLDGIIESFIGGVGSAGAMSFAVSGGKQNFDTVTNKLKENGMSDVEIEMFSDAVAIEISNKREAINPIFEENIEKSVKSLNEYIDNNVSQFEEQKRIETKSQLENIQQTTFEDLKKVMPEKEAFANSKLMQAFSLFGSKETGLSPSEYYELRAPDVLKNARKSDGEVFEQSAMYRNPRKTMGEFFDYVSENVEEKSSYYNHITKDGVSIDVPSDTILHDINKHKTVKEEFINVLENIDNVENWSLSNRKTNTGNQSLLLKIDTPVGKYGVTIGLNNGRNFLKTIFKSTDNGIDTWIKKETAKKLSSQPTASESVSTFPVAPFSQSLKSIIANIHKNVNKDIEKPSSVDAKQIRTDEGLKNEKSSYEQSMTQKSDGVNIGRDRKIIDFIIEKGGINDIAADMQEWGSDYFQGLSKSEGGMSIGKASKLVYEAGLSKTKLNDADFIDMLFYAMEANLPNNKNILNDGSNVGVFEKVEFNPIENIEGPRGYIDLKKDGGALISLLEKADASTFVHEMGHFFLNEMQAFAKMSDESARRLKSVNAWLGVENGVYTREHHEQFARGFEQFIREGEAPNSRLKEVFERFADWLRTIYKSANELNVELNDDIRAVYSDIFGGKDLDYFMRDNVPIEQMVEYNRHKAKTDRKRMEDIYSDNLSQVNIKKSRLSRTWDSTVETANKMREWLSDSIVPLEEEIRRISPEIWAKNRKLEISKLQANREVLMKAKPFIEGMSKINPDDFYTLDLALKNRDFKKVQNLLKKHNLTEEFKQIRSLLADIRSEMLDIGVSVGYLENYYPRRIKKAKDMLDYIEQRYHGTEEYSMIERAIKEKESDGRVLSDEDRVQIVNSLIRGYGGTITLSNIGSVKTRQIDVIDAEMNKFYKSSTDALVDYLSMSTNLIQNKKYFGKENKDVQGLRTRIRGRETKLKEYVAMDSSLAKGKELRRLNYEIGGLDAQIRNSFLDEDKKRLQSRKEYIESQVALFSSMKAETVKKITISRMENELAPLKEDLKLKADDTIEKSIGNIILKLVEDGKIKASEEKRLRELLTARFSDKGLSNEGLKYLRDMGYVSVLGNFESAITQFGDLGTSAWQNGLWNTGVEYVNAWAKKSKIDMFSVGLDKVIADEFNKDVSALSKTLDKTLKYTGFELIDSLAKQTTMNAAVKKARSDAKKGKKELIDYLEVQFGKENAKRVQKDLIDGKQTPEIIEYAMFQLFDIQPVTIDQMPKYYAEGGNKRMFYMMKSYFVKQLNLYRHLVFEKTRTDPIGAIGDMARLTMYLTIFNTGADLLKDLIFGRPLDVPDTMIDNLFLGGAINKWTVSRFKQEGFSGVVGNFITPPIFVDMILKDVMSKKDIADYRSWGNVPVVGRPYYWYVGGGRAKVEEDKAKERRKGKKKNKREI